MKIAIHILFVMVLLMLGSRPAYTQTNRLVLTNGTTLTGNLGVFVHGGTGSYVVYNDTAKYALSQVSSFTFNNAFYVTRQHAHTTAGTQRIFETILLKRVLDNRLDLYSRVKESLAHVDASRYDYFARTEQGLYPFNYENLRKALADDPESIRLLEGYQTWKWVGVGLILLGSTITIYELGKSFQGREIDPSPTATSPSNFSLSTTALVGVGISLSGIVPMLLRRGKLYKAVEVYNQP